ncbi:hypothetical protein [Ideonella sp.]|uniref:hypothetical protein n=1 Tax=Ideonella sp. TaxID=1929293 RepID=UPI002B4676AA|nr:hypothetical protein [Ideonella sp.]HJV68878.1 hypothetical protein [Ideonella sp.]
MATPHLIDLNHREIRSAEQLVEWAVIAFRFGDAKPAPLALERFIGAIYEHLLKHRLAFKVQELHVSEAAPAVLELLGGPNGWRQVLGFHLYRDSDNSSAYVFFNQAS